MREEIRKMLGEAGFTPAREEVKKMDTPQGLTMEQVLEIVKTFAAESKKMNPIEQKKYDDEIKAEERRKMMMVELGKAEEQAMINRKNGCSHSRHSMSAGKLGGHSCAKGAGEWTTGGQIHSDGTATMVCTRCSWTWHWQPTAREREYIDNAGMLGMAPPSEERLIKDEPIAV
jgi:hypothetical protein